MTTRTTTRTTTTTTTNKNKNENEKEDQKQQQQRRQRRCSSQHVMSASSDEIPLSLSLPRPLQASPVCEALQFGSAGSTRVACPTSVPERLELYGEARPKPPTLRRRAPKNTKNPSGGWGRAFWPESGSLISVSKSILPPPPRLEGT